MALIAAIFILLIAIAHSVYGEKKQIPELKKITNDTIVVGSHRIMIHQGGAILFATGLLQFLVAIESVNLSGAARYIPLAVVGINMLISLLIILTLHPQILRITAPQFVIFLLIIAMLFMSI